MHLVIAYDIPNDRRRQKTARLLKGYGQRVQYSVFEAHLTAGQLKGLKSQLEKLINKKEDSVRIYGLEGTQPRQVYLMGLGVKVEEPQTMII